MRLGQFARGRELLLPFLPAAGAAGPGDEALVELRGALAEATPSGGELTAALELWDGYARGGREHEKAYARARAASSPADVAPDAAVRAWRASAERGLARAVLGAKAAAYLRAQGDASGASAIDAETAAARQAMGFDDAQPAAQGAGDAGRLGLAIALTGSSSPSARRRCARRCWRWARRPGDDDGGGRPAPRRCSSACATRAASPSARARGWGSWRATRR